ncbi:Hsp70 family protein [Saccharopolyspora rectivirgula]|uniref:Hsp70 family protein n=1 Tax=Saccharopolyspora rectivirgula TaxID=28042 RepID=UPI002408F593|nr:Hsp70 family protein [Saccharopolyspora rectivirgula]
MPYVLGVHLGATVTSAAIARRDGRQWVAPVPVSLNGGPGTRPVVPTVLCRVQDGSYLAGPAAQQRETTHHEWVARGFTRFVGEDLPLLIGSEFVPAEQLAATMVEWVADHVAHQQGHPPEHIAVAHPATWGAHRTAALHQALARLGLTDVTMLPEPLAVALDYGNKQQVEQQNAIAVGNIGGSGLDATVLRCRDFGFEIVGQPLDSPYPSGQDLDDVVFGLVREQFAEQINALDPTDRAHRTALANLRAECARAKEVLSYHPGVQIRVDIPGLRTEYSLSRFRYEQAVRPHLERVPGLIQQSLQSAGLSTEDVSAVVLAGGTARTPLLRQLVADRLGETPQVDAAPELVAATGAAQAAVRVLSADTDKAESAAETRLIMAVDDDQSDFPAEEPATAPPPPIEVEPAPLEPPDEERAKRMKTIKIVAAVVLILGGVILTFLWPNASVSGVFGALHTMLRS